MNEIIVPPKNRKRQEPKLNINMINGELVVSTLVICEQLNVEHHAIIQLVKKYESEFQDIRTFAFQMQKSAGRPTSFCYLDEEQSTFLVMLMKNSETVLKFKKKLNKAFHKMRKFILSQAAQKNNAEYIEARKTGKFIRLSSTDTVKEFVEYATSQGSSNAHHYYSNISKMENKALFLLDQKYKNIRDILNIEQLMTVSVADKIVSKALSDGMNERLNYKDIYKKAKANVETLVSVYGRTEVPTFDRNQIAA